jgi:predicted Rossmann fold nucleotide-binding protein DprA/Smf involved in DNA uptake
MTEFTKTIATTAARDAVTVISGGAKGVDVTSMDASLEAGGNVVGVLADSLWRKVVNRENRDAIVDGRLLLLSPFDPESRFLVWNAMGRNKVIYALAQAGLVVNADFKKGGTWSGATEALEKYPGIPVFVRNMKSKALQALHDAGARAWPSEFKGGLHDWMASSEFKAMATPRPKDIGGLFDGIDS